MPELWAFAALVVMGWLAQIVLSYRQAMAFSHRIADLRRSGTVAVGLGRGRFRSRVFAVIAVGRDDRVVGVEVLRGLTTLSSSKPIPGLRGLPYERLCDHPVVADFDKALREALCQAVKTLRDDRASQRPAEGGEPIAEHA